MLLRRRPHNIKTSGCTMAHSSPRLLAMALQGSPICVALIAATAKAAIISPKPKKRSAAITLLYL